MSDPIAMHFEILNASVKSMAAATVDQSKDNKARLDTDTLKKSLVKNLTEEQQLLMRVVLGGDFASEQPQGIDQFKMPENAAELLRHSNLKLFENKLRQITEDYPCQPDAALFRTFISIDGFRKGTNSQAGGLTVFMMHPFTGLESSDDRKKRVSILADDATDKDYAEKLLNADYFFPSTVDEALGMLDSLISLIKFLSIKGDYVETVATEGYALGMRLIKQHRRFIHTRQLEDKLFLTKLLHQLDHNDQIFYNSLLEVLRDPLQRRYPLVYTAHCRSTRLSEVNYVFTSLQREVEPNFRLPPHLQDALRPPPPTAKTATGGAGGAAAQDRPPKSQQPWWTVKLADESPAWNLPAGKVFADFFTKGDRTLFPGISALHHAERKRRPICLPYLTAGKCTKECYFAHIRTAKSLPEADAKTIDDYVLKCYAKV